MTRRLPEPPDPTIELATHASRSSHEPKRCATRFSLHEELVALVRAGLTHAEVLRASTLVPAEHLGAADSLGTVEAGRLADGALDSNPLNYIANTQRIRAVVVDGRLLDREALDALLKGAERAARE